MYGNPEAPSTLVKECGPRFVAKDNHCDHMLRSVFNQESHIAWQICDAETVKVSGAIVTRFSGISDDFAKDIEAGKVIDRGHGVILWRPRSRGSKGRHRGLFG